MTCLPMTGLPMTGLEGRSILLVEDEMLVAHDIACELQLAGATVSTASNVADAIHMIELDDLSAAVLDFGDDVNALCGRLRVRGIPFILHSGYGRPGDTVEGGAVIPKPAAPARLVEGLIGLLGIEI